MNFLTRATEALEALDIRPNDCLTETAARVINKAARASLWPHTEAADAAIRRLRRNGVSRLDCASYMETLSWAIAMDRTEIAS